MQFDDFFDQEDFMIDPEDLENKSDEVWETGIDPDIFVSGAEQDIFSTKDC